MLFLIPSHQIKFFNSFRLIFLFIISRLKTEAKDISFSLHYILYACYLSSMI